MSASVTIRKASAQDIPELVAIWTEISQRDFARQIGTEHTQTFIDNGSLQEETTDLIDQTFVATKNAQTLGFVVILSDLIELLLVRPDVQSGLVGKHLYLFAKTQIARAHNQVRAECFAANTRAISMLERLGFECTGSYVEDMGFKTNQYRLRLS